MDHQGAESALEKVRRDLETLLPRSNNTATINVNAGGVGVWVVVTCALVMLAALSVAVPVGVGAYIATQSEIKQLQNTDSAIRAYINTGKMPPAPEKK